MEVPPSQPRRDQRRHLRGPSQRKSLGIHALSGYRPARDRSDLSEAAGVLARRTLGRLQGSQISSFEATTQYFGPRPDDRSSSRQLLLDYPLHDIHCAICL